MAEFHALRSCRAVLAKIEQASLALWNELKRADRRETIVSLVACKQKHYADSTRVIQACEMLRSGSPPGTTAIKGS